MRISFRVAIVLFLAVQAVVLLFQIDRWPLTCYPMYSNRSHYRDQILHVAAVGGDGSRRPISHPLNWSLNGPPLHRGLTAFERRFLDELLPFACPAPEQCRIVKTHIIPKEDGTFAFDTSDF